MEGPEVTFLFQFGSMRDAVSVPASVLNLKSLKDMACEFINTKVNIYLVLFYFLIINNTIYKLLTISSVI